MPYKYLYLHFLIFIIQPFRCAQDIRRKFVLACTYIFTVKLCAQTTNLIYFVS